ncbi:hypothetical protein GGI11_000154 [Coemansia sp. RSA 2049]|nr:hypothetical protein GGI11_000154 [Coemansia sp. RSA 2049]
MADDHSKRGIEAFERLARGDDSHGANSARGACKKCNSVGHLTYECKNTLKLGAPGRPNALTSRKNGRLDPIAAEKARLRAEIEALKADLHGRRSTSSKGRSRARHGGGHSERTKSRGRSRSPDSSESSSSSSSSSESGSSASSDSDSDAGYSSDSSSISSTSDSSDSSSSSNASEHSARRQHHRLLTMVEERLEEMSDTVVDVLADRVVAELEEKDRPAGAAATPRTRSSTTRSPARQRNGRPATPASAEQPPYPECEDSEDDAYLSYAYYMRAFR